MSSQILENLISSTDLSAALAKSLYVIVVKIEIPLKINLTKFPTLNLVFNFDIFFANEETMKPRGIFCGRIIKKSVIESKFWVFPISLFCLNVFSIIGNLKTTLHGNRVWLLFVKCETIRNNGNWLIKSTAFDKIIWTSKTAIWVQRAQP